MEGLIVKIQNLNVSCFNNRNICAKTKFGNQIVQESATVSSNAAKNNIQQSTNMLNQLMPLCLLSASCKNPNPFLFLAATNAINNNSQANQNTNNNTSNNDELYKMAFLYYMMTN